MGTPRKALVRAAKLAGGEAPEKPPVAPLLCPKCNAPVPLGDGETATCSHCQASVPLPPAYRELRDASRQRTADRDVAEKLYRELGSPPSPALRAWASLVALATGGVFVVVYAILTVSAALMLLAGFALELVLHLVSGPLGIDFIDRFGGGTTYAGFLAILIVFGLFPNWLVGYLDSLAEIKRTLQGSLAARPPEKPGFPSTCRGCGAALDVPPGAYGVRCAYCQADNIVSLPAEWIAQIGTKQENFHKSIVDAVDAANAIRKETRAILPPVALACVGGVLVFGLIGRGCTSLDCDQVGGSYRQSMGPPRQMIAYLDPANGVAIDKLAPFHHLPYTVALHHREHLVWSSPDCGWGGKITIKNTTTFPFLTKEWELPWLGRVDGTYATEFVAPYTGLFTVSLRTTNYDEAPMQLRWYVGKVAAAGIPAPPENIAIADAQPIAPALLPAAASFAAAKVDARLAIDFPDRPDVLVTSGTHDKASNQVVFSSISNREKGQTHDDDEPVIALAAARGGPLSLPVEKRSAVALFAIVTKSKIGAGIVEPKIFDSGSRGSLPDSAGVTSVAFISDTLLAGGDASGVIRVWNVFSGIELYRLPKLPGAVTALAVSTDERTLTAMYAGGAKSFTVANPAVWETPAPPK